MQLWLAAVFIDFGKNKCNFLHNNELDIIWRVQFLTGHCPVKSFLVGQSPRLSYGSRRLHSQELLLVQVLALYEAT